MVNVSIVIVTMLTLACSSKYCCAWLQPHRGVSMTNSRFSKREQVTFFFSVFPILLFSFTSGGDLHFTWGFLSMPFAICGWWVELAYCMLVYKYDIFGFTSCRYLNRPSVYCCWSNHMHIQSVSNSRLGCGMSGIVGTTILFRLICFY